LQELEEIVGAAGLVADAGQAKATEGLAADDGAGNLAIYVKVTDAEVAPRLFVVARIAGEQAAGEGEVGVEGKGEGLIESFGPEDTEDRAEYRFTCKRAGRVDVGEDGGANVVAGRVLARTLEGESGVRPSISLRTNGADSLRTRRIEPLRANRAGGRL